MTNIVPIKLRHDIYELTVRDNRIIRVVKLIGDSQMPREIDWDELPFEVREALMTALLSDEDDPV